MRKPSFEFTPSHDAFIRENYGRLPAMEIARHIGCSRETLYTYCKKNKIRSIPDELIPVVSLLYRQGCDIISIGRQVGRDPNVIRLFITNNYDMLMPGETDTFDYSRMDLSDASQLIGMDTQSFMKMLAAAGSRALVSKDNTVSIKEYLSFLKKHPECYDATKCDRYFFKQYAWFNKKYRADFERLRNSRYSQSVRW